MNTKPLAVSSMYRIPEVVIRKGIATFELLLNRSLQAAEAPCFFSYRSFDGISRRVPTGLAALRPFYQLPYERFHEGSVCTLGLFALPHHRGRKYGAGDFDLLLSKTFAGHPGAQIQSAGPCLPVASTAGNPYRFAL